MNQENHLYSEGSSIENISRIRGKCIHKKRSPRYNRTTNEQREKFLALTLDWKNSMREVKILDYLLQTAKQCQINYSTAKTIMKIYRSEGRVYKKNFRLECLSLKKKAEPIVLPLPPNCAPVQPPNLALEWSEILHTRIVKEDLWSRILTERLVRNNEFN